MAAALPATVPFIEAAMSAEPGLLTNHVSLATQLDRLILSPFRSVLNEEVLGETPAKGPFLIIIDGLDECEDKGGVEEFIDHILNFFEEHPTIPLRIFIASRVEQHIRACLETDAVVLGNLDGHSARRDIEKFLEASFLIVAKKDRVIRAYVRERGSWPTPLDMDKLIKHINGSFVLASTMFKYITQAPTQKDPTTPMERLPLTLEMNGLDGLYTQTLTRSDHLPHFRNIISAVALLEEPHPIVGIAGLLGVAAFEVIPVLLNLQAIIHVPGTDEEGEVTLCHTSLRDFLTTESRSKGFFVPPSFHLHLSYHCFASLIERRYGWLPNSGYCGEYFDGHWQSFKDSEDCNFLQEIEQLKASQTLAVDALHYHTFLCSMFFYTLFLIESAPLLEDTSKWRLLTNCTNQLALAAEFPDSWIRPWLEQGLYYANFGDSLHRVSFTEDTYETIQYDLQRASTAIHANVCFSNFIPYYFMQLKAPM
ncbi:hypothetical protein EST38_g14241 [Candolleomyces aberdarensis]|uniref:Nephrocystin 3-like N-terminal domain-containing protein n=1 Tax=Candolleomyces aberdarensis TaxID=2316362 RepID=A0A4Q2D064_9AGAR|nr:hypothetical protein EST38_g14241 [Candolleomyces aberdarensis]